MRAKWSDYGGTVNTSRLASGWLSAGLTGAERRGGVDQEGIAVSSGVLETPVGPVHFARESAQTLPVPGPAGPRTGALL